MAQGIAVQHVVKYTCNPMGMRVALPRGTRNFRDQKKGYRQALGSMWPLSTRGLCRCMHPSRATSPFLVTSPCFQWSFALFVRIDERCLTSPFVPSKPHHPLPLSNSCYSAPITMLAAPQDAVTFQPTLHRPSPHCSPMKSLFKLCMPRV
jgi:hypothetical protein